MNRPVSGGNIGLEQLRKLRDARLYGIVDLGYVTPENAPGICRALVSGGAGIIQLRAKHAAETLIRRCAVELIPICRAAGVPFILNDFPLLAGELGADGIHIGQDDGSLEAAREDFRSAAARPHAKMIIGRSTHSLAQARAALAEGFDYIGFGPLFPTPTKQGRPGIGLTDIAAMEREIGAGIPAFCIGGIKRANLDHVLAAGARRIVIVSDLLQAENPAAATAEAIALLTRGSEH